MGEHLLGYRVIRRLADGVLVESLLAEAEVFSQQVVFKSLRASLSKDAAAAQGFVDRARAWKELRNLGIANCLDVLTLPDGRPTTVVEHLPGVSLAELLEKGPLPQAQVRSLAVSLCGTLQALHEQGVVHGSVCPDKIILPDGPTGTRAKLVDIGWPLSPEHRLAALEAAGPYASPEFLRGEALDDAADQYALGALITELLSGVPPFVAPDADTLLSLKVAWPVPPQLDEFPELAPILERCFKENPAERHPDLGVLGRLILMAPVPSKKPRNAMDTQETPSGALHEALAHKESAKASTERIIETLAQHTPLPPHIRPAPSLVPFAIDTVESAAAPPPAPPPPGEDVLEPTQFAPAPLPGSPPPALPSPPAEAASPSEPGAAPVQAASPRPARRRPRLAAALFAAALLVGAGGYAATTRQVAERAFLERLEAADARLRAGRLAGPGGDEAVDVLIAARALRPVDPRLAARVGPLLETLDALAASARARGNGAEEAAHRAAAARLRASTP